MQDIIQKIKSSLRLEDIASNYLDIKPTGKTLKATCPNHEDKTPSLDICPTRQTYKCFSCGVQGDLIDFVEMMEQVNTSKAINILSAKLGLNTQKPLENKSKTIIKPNLNQTLKQIITYYQGQLSKNTPPQDYLKSRGLFIPELINTFKIGFCTGGIKKLLPNDETLFSELQTIGILNENQNETLYKCLTFPIFDEDETLKGIYGRGVYTKNHKYLKGGHKGVFNHKALKVYREIIITESIIDCLSLYALGVKNTIPIYGLNGLSQAHLELLKLHNPQKITFLLDNDEPASQALSENGEILTKLKPLNIPIFKADLPKSINDKPIKDINDFLVNGGFFGEISQIIDQAQPIQTPQEKSNLEKTKKGELLPTSENEALYCGNATNSTYTLKGLQTIGSQSMRLVIGIKHNNQYHTDRIDLYSFKARKSFARVAEKELGLNIIHIEKDLLDLLTALETHLDTIQAQENEPVIPDKILTETEKQEALTLLKNPNLLNKVSDDLTQLGYAGEDKNKKLTYLVAVSRKLDSPLSCMIRSQSGAGKSQLMEKVASLVPEEDLLLFSRISQQSLFYMPKDALVHKLVIIDERNGSEASDYAIRSLQTQHKLTQAVVMKDPSTGKQKTQMFEIYGPIAYMDSSTQTEVNPENENRCFVIYLGENQDQTNLVLQAQRQSRTIDGWHKKQNKEALQTLHKNAQRMLRPLKVIIPFADKMTFPDKWVRVRRDQERFLSLIEASAFLHQYQRPIKSCELGEYIEATIDDYAVAYELAKDILQSSLSDLSKMASNVYHTIKSHVENIAEDENLPLERVEFTQRDVREWTSLSLQVVKNAVKELYQLEYINGFGGGRGSRFKYTLNGNCECLSLIGLLTPDELRKSL